MNRWIKIFSGIVVLGIAVVVAAVAILKSMDFNKYKGQVASLVREVTGRELKIAGDLKLNISLNPSLSVENVSLANAAWGSSPDMVTVRHFAAEVSIIPLLSGTLDVNRVVLDGVNVVAETDKTGKGNWVFGGPSGKKSESEADGKSTSGVLPVVRLVSIKDVTLTYKDGIKGEAYKLALDRLTLQADGATAPLKLNMSGSVNGQAIELDGTLGSVSTMTAGGMIPLDVNIAAFASRVMMKGQVGAPDGKPAADAKVSVSIANLSQTIEAASGVVPALKNMVLPPVDGLDLTLKAKYTGDSLSLADVALKIGATDLTGNIRLGLGGPVPVIEGKLASDLINLDELLPKPASEKQVVENTDGRVFSDASIPLDGLKVANVSLHFTGKKILVQGIDVTDTSVELTVQSGKLEFRPAARIFNGSVSGDVKLNAGGKMPVLDARLNVAKLDYGKALASRDMNDIAEGLVDINIDVTGSGNSVRSLMAGLSGKTRIVTEDGQLKSGALNIVSTDLLNVFDSKDDKKLRCGVVDFDIVSGMANVRSIVLETGGFSVIGTGDVNLKSEQPNLRIDPRAKKTNLATVAMVPVNVHGTLAKPDWTIDATAAAGNIAAGAARTGAAVATMGLSLLVEKAVTTATGMAVDTNDYCVPALAGKKVVPGQTKSTSGAKTDSKSPVQPIGKTPADALKNIGDGIGSGLKGLFGSGAN